MKWKIEEEAGEQIEKGDEMSVLKSVDEIMEIARMALRVEASK